MKNDELILQVNTAGAWKSVLTFDRARKADVLASVKRLAVAVPGAKWCLVNGNGDREWIEPLAAGQQDSMRTLNCALDIADGSCRADVECYAHCQAREGGGDLYDLTRPASTHASETEETMAAQVRIAQRAADHIRARGDVFPWRMCEVPGAPHLVWFEKKGE